MEKGLANVNYKNVMTKAKPKRHLPCYYLHVLLEVQFAAFVRHVTAAAKQMAFGKYSLTSLQFQPKVHKLVSTATLTGVSLLQKIFIPRATALANADPLPQKQVPCVPKICSAHGIPSEISA